MYEPRQLDPGYINVEAWVSLEYKSQLDKAADEKVAASAAQKAKEAAAASEKIAAEEAAR